MVFSADGSPRVKDYRGRGGYLYTQDTNKANSRKMRDSVTTTSDQRGRTMEDTLIDIKYIEDPTSVKTKPSSNNNMAYELHHV